MTVALVASGVNAGVFSEVEAHVILHTLLSAGGESPFAGFECSGTPLSLLGAAIGQLTPPDKTSTVLAVEFAGKGAEQKPERFAGGPAQGLTLSGIGDSRPVAIVAEMKFENAEGVEVRALP